MKNNEVCIIDYGMGNIGSIQNIIKKVGGKSIISSNSSVIESANKIILPGVGSFNKAMTNLSNLNLINTLNHKAKNEKTPLLGICLGMQLLTNYSEEGDCEGLKFIDATTKKFHFDLNLKIPHMGWNTVIPEKNTQITNELTIDSKFYFVHSYYVECKKNENILFSSKYGINFTSGIIDNNIMGVQFHPEKSHKYGMQLIRNFLSL